MMRNEIGNVCYLDESEEISPLVHINEKTSELYQTNSSLKCKFNSLS